MPNPNAVKPILLAPDLENLFEFVNPNECVDENYDACATQVTEITVNLKTTTLSQTPPTSTPTTPISINNYVSIINDENELSTFIGDGNYANAYLKTNSLSTLKYVQKVFKVNKGQVGFDDREITIMPLVFDKVKKYTIEMYNCYYNDDGKLCINMEYMNRRGYVTLKSIIERSNPPINPNHIKPIINGIIECLVYLNHSKGYLHLDLNPGNIYVNESMLFQEWTPYSKSAVVLGDFGLSMKYEEYSIKFNQTNGDSTFLSSERCDKLNDCYVSDNEDVYSLGVISMLLILACSKTHLLNGRLLYQLKNHPIKIVNETPCSIIIELVNQGYDEDGPIETVHIETSFKSIVHRAITYLKDSSSRPTPLQLTEFRKRDYYDNSQNNRYKNQYPLYTIQYINLDNCNNNYNNNNNKNNYVRE